MADERISFSGCAYLFMTFCVRAHMQMPVRILHVSGRHAFASQPVSHSCTPSGVFLLAPYLTIIESNLWRINCNYFSQSQRTLSEHSRQPNVFGALARGGLAQEHRRWRHLCSVVAIFSHLVLHVCACCQNRSPAAAAVVTAWLPAFRQTMTTMVRGCTRNRQIQ